MKSSTLSKKINNFYAHEGVTNCLKIGLKSGKLLVTGGMDKIVNLWAVGRQVPLLSLQGHVTPVESVALDWPEEFVVAGSAGGNLKLWDLEEAKIIRNLSGHRSAIRCLEFHPFGEFFASGSADQSLKIWDVRRQGCIQTYHGHSDSIENIQITPDGRWVTSASLDGSVKIWDMTAGKLLRTLELDGKIQSLVINPSEFVLGTSTKKGVSVFDLQTFQVISTIEVDADKILFTPDGQHLLACCKDSLKVMNWEPMSLEYEIEVDWNVNSPLKDLKVLEDHAIACASNGTLVEVWGFQLNGNDNRKQGLPELVESLKENNGNLKTKTTAIQPPKEKPKPLPSQYPRVSKTLEIDQLSEISSSLPRPDLNKDANNVQSHPVVEEKSKTPEATVKTSKFKYVPSCDGNKILNLDLSKFVLKQPGIPSLPMYLSQQGLELSESLSFRNTSMLTILNTRLDNIKLVREAWKESVKSAVEQLTSIRDSAVLVDILRIIIVKPSSISLEVAAELLPLVGELLFETFEDYVTVACKALMMMSKAFANIIQTTIEITSGQSILDLVMEDRLRKCEKCKAEFINSGLILKEMSATGSLGETIKMTMDNLTIYE